jgi:hypothetical protein
MLNRYYSDIEIKSNYTSQSRVMQVVSGKAFEFVVNVLADLDILEHLTQFVDVFRRHTDFL